MKFDLYIESILTELFSSTMKRDVEWKRDDSFANQPKYTTTFQASNKREYLVELQNITWHGSAHEENYPENLQKILANKKTKIYEVVFKDVKFSNSNSTRSIKKAIGITGKGGAIDVFSNVVDILRDFLKNVQPDTRILYFVAFEPSRAKLYDRMVKVLAPEYGFKIFTDSDEEAHYYACYR